MAVEKETVPVWGGEREQKSIGSICEFTARSGEREMSKYEQSGEKKRNPSPLKKKKKGGTANNFNTKKRNVVHENDTDLIQQFKGPVWKNQVASNGKKEYCEQR